MTPPQTASEALRRLILPVYLPSLLHAIGATAILPLVSLIALRLGFDVPAAAALTVVMGVVGVLGPIPIGAWMQRVGERFSLILTGIVLVVTNLLGFQMLERGGAGPWDRAGFVAILVMMALTQQVWALGRQSYMGAVLPEQFRARGMSTFGGMARIGQVLGPALGAVVIGMGHLSWIYLLDAVTLGAATILVAASMLPGETDRGLTHAEAVAERIDRREPSPFAPGRSALATMILVSLGITPLVVGRFARQTIVPLAGAAWGVSEQTISLIFAVAAVFEILVFVPAGFIMDRFGRAAVAVPCLLIMGTSYLALGVATPWLQHATPHLAGLVLGAATVGMAIGNGLGSGIVMTLGVDLSPQQARTRHLARWQAIQGFGRLVAPLVVSAVTLVAPVAAAGAVVGSGCAVGGLWLSRFLPTVTPPPSRVIVHD